MANKRLHNMLQGKPSYVVTSVGQIGFHKCTRRGPGGEVGRDDGVMMQAAVVVTQIEPLWGKAGTPSGQQHPPPTPHSLFSTSRSLTFLDFHRSLLMVTIFPNYNFNLKFQLCSTLILSLIRKCMLGEISEINHFEDQV